MDLLAMLLGPALVVMGLVVWACIAAGANVLATVGFGMVSWGIVQFLVGWFFNQHTPMQQPTPIVGAAVVVLGIIVLALSI